jgi:hypothetical protein
MATRTARIASSVCCSSAWSFSICVAVHKRSLSQQREVQGGRTGKQVLYSSYPRVRRLHSFHGTACLGDALQGAIVEKQGGFGLRATDQPRTAPVS